MEPKWLPWGRIFLKQEHQTSQMVTKAIFKSKHLTKQILLKDTHESCQEEGRGVTVHQEA